ncbi:hypothetical protein PHMEG_0001403 [Phytophthora megakarya]|uniref:Eukaryotic/viral aspartic protease n=1 Tax=Phytophthora megakarya TaxID=4795 RepID=A0A225X1S9_9STRA|nr:hypothetical protein PHMEG_0001403 [Phytophthora megakarya]
MEEFYNQIRQSFNPTKHIGCREYVKLGRSSGWNPIRAERSRYYIYALVPKTSVDQVNKQRDLPDITRDLHGNHIFAISSPRQLDEFVRSDVAMTVDLHPGQSRGYQKQQDNNDLDTRRHWIYFLENPVVIGNIMPLIVGKIYNENAILLLDIGAKVSYVDTAFARKVGCYRDSIQIQDCVENGDNVYRTEGRTRIKVTLAESYVGGDQSGQEVILGMDVMVPAGIHLDIAYGSNILPNEVQFLLSGRQQLYSDKTRIVNLE